MAAAAAGWEQAFDQTRQRAYYFNARTGERRWQPPSAQLPPGWDEAFDQTRQRAYFYNRATGVRQWHPPAGAAAGATLNPLAAGSAPTRTRLEKVTVVDGTPLSLERANSAAKQLDDRDDDACVTWYQLWLLAIALCALSLVVALAVAAGLSIVVDAADWYNLMLFATLLAVAATSALGLFALLSRHRWGLLLVFALCLFLLSAVQGWFAVELFTDNVLPSRIDDDWALYNHIRDSYRHRIGCAANGSSAALLRNASRDRQRSRTGFNHSQCQDFELDCPVWAAAGECVPNEVWMRTNCPLSCGVCEAPAFNITLAAEEICTCRRDRFCGCSDADASACVKTYFKSRQTLWTCLCAVVGLVQLIVVYFAVRFALKLRADESYFEEVWKEHLDDEHSDAPAVPAVPDASGLAPPIPDVDGGYGDEGEYGEEGEAQPGRVALWTYGVLVVCLVVLMWTVVLNNGIEDYRTNFLLGPKEEVLVSCGAKDVSKIQQGEWWRLCTAMWLHGGFVHLGMNAIGLLRLGTDLETEHGHARIIAIYLPSGIFGATLSAIFLPWQVGVGASGALFGLFGSCWAELVQNWHEIPEGEGRGAIMQIALMTIINLGMGMTPLLDNFAHLGGFIFGFLAGVVFLPKPKAGKRTLSMQQRGLQVLAGVAAVAAFGAALLVLFTGIDAVGKCEWCSYISCVDTPWWDCEAIERDAQLPPCTRFRTDAGEEDVLQCGEDVTARHRIPDGAENDVVVTLCESLCAP